MGYKRGANIIEAMWTLLKCKAEPNFAVFTVTTGELVASLQIPKQAVKIRQDE